LPKLRLGNVEQDGAIRLEVAVVAEERVEVAGVEEEGEWADSQQDLEGHASVHAADTLYLM
jgi:hypothetical protein